MISVLLFTGLSLGIVCVVFTDCQAANDRTPGAKKSPKDRASRD
ncbi:MAG TPA: hypothetical protein VG936_03455 [Lacunisphaera sp.]|nr:hypothetical protein [Lacunisphaera sp.]